MRRFLPLLALLTGCTKESTEGSLTTVQFAFWVQAVGIVVTLMIVGVGIALIRHSRLLGAILLIVLLPLPALIVPGLLLDRVRVDDDRFTLRTGFWFSPTKHDIRYEDLKMMRAYTVTKRARRGTSTSYYLDCQQKDGSVVRVPLGDLMRSCRSRIQEKAVMKGVVVVDEIPAN